MSHNSSNNGSTNNPVPSSSLTEPLALEYHHGDLSEYIFDFILFDHITNIPVEKRVKVPCVLRNVKQDMIRKMLSNEAGWDVLRAILEVLETGVDSLTFLANPDGEQDGLTNEKFLEEVTTTYASDAFKSYLQKTKGDAAMISYAGKMEGGRVGVKWVLYK